MRRLQVAAVKDLPCRVDPVTQWDSRWDVQIRDFFGFREATAADLPRIIEIYNADLIAQDLTVFTLAPDAVITRQAGVVPTAWPVLGRTHISGPPKSFGAPW